MCARAAVARWRRRSRRRDELTGTREAGGARSGKLRRAMARAWCFDERGEVAGLKVECEQRAVERVSGRSSEPGPAGQAAPAHS